RRRGLARAAAEAPHRLGGPVAHPAARGLPLLGVDDSGPRRARHGRLAGGSERAAPRVRGARGAVAGTLSQPRSLSVHVTWFAVCPVMTLGSSTASTGVAVGASVGDAVAPGVAVGCGVGWISPLTSCEFEAPGLVLPVILIGLLSPSAVNSTS